MNDAGGKVELPQGECGNYLPINAYNRNTSLRQPEGRVDAPPAQQGIAPRPDWDNVRCFRRVLGRRERHQPVNPGTANGFVLRRTGPG